jgi:DNA-binding MarR family transcriptional regulator
MFGIMRTAHPSYVSLFVDVLAQLYEALRPRQLPELTLPQINILNALDLLTPTHPSDLAEKRGVSRAAISQSMRRLIDLGLVDRRRCLSDRRFVELRLTPEGDRLRRLPTVIDPERVDEVLVRLTVDLRYAVRRTLIDIETSLSAARGRDFWVVHGLCRRDVRRKPRRWAVAAGPRESPVPGRPPVRLSRYPPTIEEA